MATIVKQGNGYKIEVHKGYDTHGKRLREYTTWVPSPGMTERQAEKEVAKAAALFENEVKNGNTVDSRIKFEVFAEKYMKEYGALYLKPKPLKTYSENLVKINAAIGHIRLCDLNASHINSFYTNLQEEGMRAKTVAVSKTDLKSWLKEHSLSISKFAAMTGLSRATIKAAIDKEHISKASATKISQAMDAKLSRTFTLLPDLTPLAPATILAYHRTLSAILTKAVRWGYIKYNPAQAAEKPKLGPHEAPYLEEDEARQLLILLQDEPIRWRAPIIFDLLSGLRRGEILGLRWCDVDLDACMLQVQQTSNYLPDLGIYKGTPKTGSSKRPLRLSRSAIVLLLEYQRWQDAQRMALGDAWADKDDRIFTTDRGAPIFPDSLTAWFTAFVQRSNLPKVTVHSLRHTYATLMIADGTPLVAVSHQLGHAQPSTTGNIYAHAIASAQQKAAQTFDRFNDLLIPPSEPGEDTAGTVTKKEEKAAEA